MGSWVSSRIGLEALTNYQNPAHERLGKGKGTP
jgi:hypothetical protein